MEPIGFVVRQREDTRSGLDDKEVAQLPDPHPVTWSRRHSQLNSSQVNPMKAEVTALPQLSSISSFQNRQNTSTWEEQGGS